MHWCFQREGSAFFKAVILSLAHCHFFPRISHAFLEDAQSASRSHFRSLISFWERTSMTTSERRPRQEGSSVFSIFVGKPLLSWGIFFSLSCKLARSLSPYSL